MDSTVLTRLGPRWLPVAACASALIAGCGDSGNGKSSNAGAGGPGSPAQSELAPEAAAVDRVRIALGDGPRTLDPIQINANNDAKVIDLIGGRLFRLERGSLSETVPELAESGELSDDQRSFTVTLRENLAFSDGSPLTAADVKSSLERGIGVESAVSATFANIASVRVEDPSTVTIRMERPSASLAQQLATPAAAIVPKAAASDKRFFDAPVVSGRYAVDGDWKGNSFTLLRNDRYGGSKPAIDRLDFAVIRDSNAAVTQLRGGRIDFAADIPAESVTTLKGNVAGKALEGTLSSILFTPNNNDPTFSDPRVRQAIGYAVDRAQLANVAFGGRAAPQTGPFTPALDYQADVFGTAPDPDRARELLAGTPCAQGCKFTVNFFASDESTEGRMAVALAQMLKPLNMDVTTAPLEDQTFIQRSVKGELSASVVSTPGYIGWNPYDVSLNPAFTACMFVGCKNDQIGPALAKLQAAGDDAATATAVGDVKTIFAEWAPWVPLTSAPQFYGVKTALETVIGFEPSGLLAIADLKR